MFKTCHCTWNSSLAAVVVFSFFVYLMAFFILERFKLKNAGAVTVAIFAITWAGLIALTTKEMKSMQRNLKSNKGRSSMVTSDNGKEKFRQKLRIYCRINGIFGTLLCIFQILCYSINVWITDDIPATIINIGFDLSCLGVAYG